MKTDKYDFIKEKIAKKSLKYYPFLLKLVEKSANLKDFTISKKEIEEQFLDKSTFYYDLFISEFDMFNELKPYQFCKNPYNDFIFHVVLKGRSLSPKFSSDIANEISLKNYDTRNIQNLINQKEKMNAQICVEIGIERFFDEYKNLNPDEENKIIAEDDFFNNYVFPLDDYKRRLSFSTDFRDDYNKYMSNYKPLDTYLEKINKVLAISGLKLVKKGTEYIFRKVPKSCSEKSPYSFVSDEIRNFGSLSLGANTNKLDGSYGDHIFRDPISGRFYSVSSYDNYGCDSNPD